jgi:hypothetical protein
MQSETKHNWGWCDRMVTHCVEWNLCIHTLECYTKPDEDQLYQIVELEEIQDFSNI